MGRRHTLIRNSSSPGTLKNVNTCNLAGNPFHALYKIFCLPREDVEKILSPRFYTYFHSIFKKPELLEDLLENRRHIMTITNSQDKTVLDFGCGMGFNCVFLSLLGAKKVIGVDDNEEYITTFQKLVQLLSLKKENIEPVFARDGIAGFKDSSVDTVIMQEVASHIPSNVFRDILQDVYRVLRTGGSVFLEDDNNKVQLPFLQEKRRRKRLRLIAENGRVSDYPQLGLEESYRTSRQRIIQAHFPTLFEKEIKMYAKKTQGMEKREVLDSVHQIIAGNKIRNKAPYPFTDPDSGHVFEMEINPFKLKKLLREKGFKPRLVPPNLAIVVKQSDSLPLRILKRILQRTIKHPKVFFYPILLFFDNNIRVLARK